MHVQFLPRYPEGACQQLPLHSLYQAEDLQLDHTVAAAEKMDSAAGVTMEAMAEEEEVEDSTTDGKEGACLAVNGGEGRLYRIASRATVEVEGQEAVAVTTAAIGETEVEEDALGSCSGIALSCMEANQ